MRIAEVRDAAGRDACFAVRRAVFIEEQAIPESEEWDDHDAAAIHILALGPAGPAGTARVIVDGATAKIGRVAVMAADRGTGLGHGIMRAAIEAATARGCTRAALDAQTYAVPFYERLGFAAEGPEFDDGSGILHRRMTRPIGPGTPP